MQNYPSEQKSGSPGWTKQSKGSQILNALNPTHYHGKIEPWDFITAQGLGFLEGNVIKYITRAGRKDGNTRYQDLLKAQTYLHKLISIEVNDHTTGSPAASNQLSTDHGATSGHIQSHYAQDSDLFDR